MDKGVLLVLLCLQAFLLITAFTSTDAAALVKDDQQQQSLDLEGTAEKGVKSKIRIRKSCGKPKICYKPSHELTPEVMEICRRSGVCGPMGPNYPKLTTAVRT